MIMDTKMWSIAVLILSVCLGSCHGFILISSSSSQSGDIVEGQLFTPGSAWNYNYTTNMICNEKDTNEKEIGFMLKSKVVVEAVWGSSHSRILKITLKSPQILTRSSDIHGFLQKSTPIATMRNEPFYVLWTKGVVEKVLSRNDEQTTMVNLKKGIASLFQFQLLDMEHQELDTSGDCKVLYTIDSPQKVHKTKLHCVNDDLPVIANPEVLLATKLHSTRTADYDISNNKEFVENVKSLEVHQMYLSAKEEVGSKVEVHQNLDFVDGTSCGIVQQATYKEVKQQLIDDIGVFNEDTLLTHWELVKKINEKDFLEIISEHRENVSDLGTLTSAKALIPMIKSARISTTEDITKALTSNKNQNILPQLYDILGYAQTKDVHDAVMKQLHFDDMSQADSIERYLWSSSLSTQPNPDIITDLLNKLKRTQNIPEKVQETLLLTIASMTHRISKISTKYSKLIHNIQDTLINNFDAAKGEERIIFLRALKNLKLPGVTSKLLEVVKNGKPKEVVQAWKTIKAMEPSSWSKDVISVAYRTYYQLDKSHDSSSRTLAADIILKSNPSDEILKGFLYHMITEDKHFEVKQYVFQQIKMLSEEDPKFKDRILKIITSDDRLNNYSALSPKGLSIALKRQYMVSSSANGSLLTVQEMSSGIVKRGVVNVMMEKHGQAQEVFSLGIFTGGLDGFLTSEANDEGESATAGMELSVLGTQIRPFTFFEGQSELMGHVWSGTGSERTTAFQALILVQDHQEHLRLGSGLIVDVDMMGAASLDLAGKIELSLWYRNAQALIENSVGFYGIGSMRLETPFMNLGIENQLSIEPKLLLNADIDFSGDVALCLRLSQPDTIFGYGVCKVEEIPESSHTIRRTKRGKVQIPGRTYFLNKKNNEMCGNMFKY